MAELGKTAGLADVPVCSESEREDGLLWTHLQRGLWEPFLLNLFPGLRAGHRGNVKFLFGPFTSLPVFRFSPHS